ncbi:hypothetical protein, partial [Zhouia amylolytica]|uniref:hypothetical protein n=1 Tax=Zhouia amylolytica TaxID=376730 RepID=UPI0020CC3332
MFEKILNLFLKPKTVTPVIEKVLELFKVKQRLLDEYNYQLAKMANEQFEKEIADLDSARKMQIEALKQNDLFSKRFIYYLTIALIGASIGVSLLPFFVEYPEGNKEFIQRGTDFLYITSGAQVIAFF